jgi:hypothetical protein
MDNVQNYDRLINIPSSQTYKLFTYSLLHLLCNLLCEVVWIRNVCAFYFY